LAALLFILPPPDGASQTIMRSPLAQEIAVSTGLPLETVLMTQVIGFTSVVVPFQASPIVIPMAMGGVKMIDGAKLTL
jgi:hypothetical protein